MAIQYFNDCKRFLCILRSITQCNVLGLMFVETSNNKNIHLFLFGKIIRKNNCNHCIISDI